MARQPQRRRQVSAAPRGRTRRGNSLPADIVAARWQELIELVDGLDPAETDRHAVAARFWTGASLLLLSGKAWARLMTTLRSEMSPQNRPIRLLKGLPAWRFMSAGGRPPKYPTALLDRLSRRAGPALRAAILREEPHSAAKRKALREAVRRRREEVRRGREAMRKAFREAARRKREAARRRR
jgi:hypothetical protein